MMKQESKKMASGERKVKTRYEGDWGIHFVSLSSCTGLAPTSTCYRVMFDMLMKEKENVGHKI